MLSPKRAGRHPQYGTIYFWCLTGIFLTASGLAVVRWAGDYHLFILGTLSFAAACLGRQARRQRWRNWVRLHITGMGSSYVLLLIAFYVDNGKQLPIWKDLPRFTWLLPLIVEVPLIVRALLASIGSTSALIKGAHYPIHISPYRARVRAQRAIRHQRRQIAPGKIISVSLEISLDLPCNIPYSLNYGTIGCRSGFGRARPGQSPQRVSPAHTGGAAGNACGRRR